MKPENVQGNSKKSHLITELGVEKLLKTKSTIEHLNLIMMSAGLTWMSPKKTDLIFL